MPAARLHAVNVAVLHRGRIVEQGPAGQVFSQPQQDLTRQLLGAIPGQRFAAGLAAAVGPKDVL